MVSRGLNMRILLVGRGLSYGSEATESWLTKDKKMVTERLKYGCEKSWINDKSVKDSDYQGI